MSNVSTAEPTIRVHTRLHRFGWTKLEDHHFTSTAIVYVRQSNPHQVLENTKSTERQYALVDLAVEFGPTSASNRCHPSRPSAVVALRP